MGISSYSTNPASNTTINGINIAEGCAPSGINDAIRQMMADIASGVPVQQLPTATGTANAVVVALSPAVTSYSGGQRFQFLPIADNTDSATINYGGGVVTLKKRGTTGVVNLALKDLLTGYPADVEYDGTQPVLMNPQSHSHGADIASAATVVLNNATGDYVDITGTTGITAITLAEGAEVTTKFTGVLTITNSASLIAPAGANYTTAAGDIIVWRGEPSGVVRAIGGIKANGLPWATAGIDINTNTTGTLNVNRGGTGVATLTDKALVVGAGTGAVTGLAPGTAGNVATSDGTNWTSAANTAPTQASTVEIAAESAVTKYISPDRLKSAPSICKAWLYGTVQTSGSIVLTLNKGYNISSITRSGSTPIFNFTNAMADVNYAALVWDDAGTNHQLSARNTGNLQLVGTPFSTSHSLSISIFD